jgi:putrescine transport system permease protein
MNRRPVFLITVMAFGFAFFYVPILSMIVYSFNASRLATVWGGFSTKWYVALLSNDQVIRAAILSLKIALLSATFATILGTMAGIAMARFRRFRGRVLFSGLVTAPLIMPEVITGISSLIFFILMAEWVGWPAQRGFTTVTLAHITFSMVFVTTIVHSRLIRADEAIEEAAMDLGSRPWQVMLDVTFIPTSNFNVLRIDSPSRNCDDALHGARPTKRNWWSIQICFICSTIAPPASAGSKCC